jgi:predicted protein tyrosine phosphatase
MITPIREIWTPTNVEKPVSFIIHSRNTAEMWLSPKNTPFIVISIHTPGSERPVFPNDPNRVNTLYLQFHDEVAPNTRHTETILMSEEQAQEVVKFVKHYVVNDLNSSLPKIDLIMIHCEAGVSRSAGVASGLSYWLNETDEYFIQSPFFRPNALCRKLIIEAAMGRPDYAKIFA